MQRWYPAYMTPLDIVRALGHHSAVAITVTNAVLDPPGPTILYANEAFAHLTGRATVDVIGISPRFMQGRNTRRPTLDKFRQALVLGERFWGFLVNYRADGSKYEVEIDCRALRNANGTIEHYLSFQREVGRRRGRPAPGAQGRYEPIAVSNEALTGELKLLGVFCS